MDIHTVVLSSIQACPDQRNNVSAGPKTSEVSKLIEALYTATTVKSDKRCVSVLYVCFVSLCPQARMRRQV